ncbi:MAG: Hsp20/alpha crystallin family protein, partial [Acidobacteria bacterium]|nr:Hsp20/alpha crystallin family protein [Acidobacteriota bacterium]
RMATPGLDAKDLQVTAFPDAIIVQAETSAETSKDEQGQGGEVRISEFSARDLFRRVELPAPIDVEKVTATLDKGILKVVAAKAEPALKEKKVFVAAGREAA